MTGIGDAPSARPAGSGGPGRSRRTPKQKKRLAWNVVLQVLAMLAIIPRRSIPLVSACGAGSMYAYMLHQLIQRQWVNWGGPEAVDGYLGVAVLALAAVALAIVLMLPAVRRPFRPLIQPRWEWFLRAAPEPRLTAEPLRTEPDRAARD